MLHTDTPEDNNKRNDLKTQIIMFHHELLEILEKVIVLENYQHQQKKNLNTFQQNALTLEINRGYQLIMINIFHLSAINHVIQQALITEEDYFEAYGKIQWPNTETIKSMTAWVRDIAGQTAFATLLKEARNTLSGLQTLESVTTSVQTQKRKDALNVIERGLHGHGNAKTDWRTELLQFRLDRIIASSLEENFQAHEFGTAIREYYDVIQGKLKPEYQHYNNDKTISKKIKKSLKILLNILENESIPEDDVKTETLLFKETLQSVMNPIEYLPFSLERKNELITKLETIMPSITASAFCKRYSMS